MAYAGAVGPEQIESAGSAVGAPAGAPRVSLITLGCARNEVDSEELAGRLASGGFELVGDGADSDVVVVNTCGFIESAKRESIEVLLAATPGEDGRGPRVVAVGCMAERYGRELAESLPEAAVLGFDDYTKIDQRLREVLAGNAPTSHAPRDRRQLLPVAPVDRPGTSAAVPGHAGPAWNWTRRRLSHGPVSALKIASGCDRRCAFCAIPSFRGLFISRPIAEVVAEARWLVGQGVREVVLVSENSTSYGKDLGDPGHLEALLEELSEVDGLTRIRVSYLQPAEVRASLVRTMVALPKVADYFDLSFQHASAPLLRRMRRFGGTGEFLELLAAIRELAPQAGVRSNFILGFPGETPADVDELVGFLESARLDAIGLFGYSDEDGTEAASLGDHVDPDEVHSRLSELADVAEELMSQRADDRIGTNVELLVELTTGGLAQGRTAEQGPDDGQTTVHLDPEAARSVAVGELVTARVVAAEGVDLVACAGSRSEAEMTAQAAQLQEAAR